MDRFTYIEDEGVRNYLSSEPSLDPSTVSSQLDVALRYNISIGMLERKALLYEQACRFFGLRRYDVVHQCLREFWEKL